ncbi:MAG TPA: PilZ domain-containing protein, partial [Syntrophales bacterium]
MDQNVQTIFGRDKGLTENDEMTAPRYFHHQDLIRNPDPGKTIKQKNLINLWNRHHFTDDMVYVHLHHPQYKEDILVRAYPEPCCGGSMTCRWPEESRRFTENADILNIILSDGLSVFLIPTRLKDVQKDHFTIYLPDKGYILGQRRARRYLCRGVYAEVVQNGFRARGLLMDFSALAFGVKVSPEAIGSFRWFNADCPSTVHLYRDEQMIFSASCHCIRQTADQEVRDIVFAPATTQMNRFLKKKLRNPRVQIKPLPNITFDHPATKKKIQLDIQDLSTSGFAVHVSAAEDVLMPGMIIPELTMNYAGALKIQCKAQVLYRHEDKKKSIRYGFVILDMDVVNYDRLSHIVMNFIDPGAHVADEVDVDQLWEFLFESGFIYPKKYGLVQAYRDPMKEIYRRLYHDNPEIFTQ